ncbi:serum response factor-binding protein 1 isoform X2 [Mixophyes fleayi]|uniref:serum response factor-binding protein 1 isoform X2 n=1 Tax=Mixophyes fleayi TaxID=3061075 RepID=UPI003F4E3078
MEEPVLNLNNEVVKMRKDVKKVKVLTIRKLTRHMAKLKSKKGTDELILKNRRRAQRLLEEIHTIKKLRPDDVTKTALRKEINFEKVFNKANSTPETRAIARLATNPLLKQKITAIKDAVKAFKEARKNLVEQEEKEQPRKPSEVAQTVNIQAENNYAKKAFKEARKNLVEQEGEKEQSCKLPSEPTQIVNTPAVNKYTVKTFKEARKNLVAQEGEKEQSCTLSEPTQTVSTQAENNCKQNKAEQEQKAVETDQKKESLDDSCSLRKEADFVGRIPSHDEDDVCPEKTVQIQPSQSVQDTNTAEKTIESIPEIKAVENRCEKETVEIISEKKVPSVYEPDSSDIEESDKEDKEYFDDSTEERFYKKPSDFDDSDSDSEDDFFIGKVRRTKKKRSNKNGSDSKMKKDKVQPESTKFTALSTDEQKGRAAPKAGKLESVFCKSLSETKQKSSYMKRENKFPPVRNKKSAVPQANTLLRNPHPARGAAVRQQSKPQGQTLHPSWEASRKRKEQSQIAVFQGKKIVFDD